MVITSPFSSIKGYVLSKPPLVLFTLCLMGFAITTFSFAYYVEHTDKLPNLDAHRDFVSFLSHLSKRTLCISTNDATATLTSINTKNASEIDELTTIFVKATFKSKNALSNLTHIQGYIPTSDWVGECTMNPVEKVKIAFDLPYSYVNQSVSNEIDTDICVMITGPSSVLAPAINFNQCTSTLSSHSVWGHIHKSSNQKYYKCSDDKVNALQNVELNYEPGNYNGVSLSTHDRSVINLHLFHTSYFLLVMAITLICYAMIKGKPITKHQPLDKVPLDV